MTQTYPTSGYRTKAAAAHAGFQSMESRFLSQPFPSRSPSTRELEDLLRQAFKPSAPRTPINIGPGASLVPKVAQRAVSLGTTALTRHPAFRLAQLAWDLNNFLAEPETKATFSKTEFYTAPGSGWTACWADCGPHPIGPNYNVGFWTTSTQSCATSWHCLNNQGSYPSGGHGWQDNVVLHEVFMGSGARNYFVGQGHWGVGSTPRWRYRQVFWRSTVNPSLDHPIRMKRTNTVLGPQSMPMPIPYRLAPKRANGPEREAGYHPNTKTAPAGIPAPPSNPTRTVTKERPPGKKTSERKFKLLSGGKLRNVVEAAFEGTEWVADLHDALPEDCKVKGFSTVAQKFVAVAKCLHRVNMCQAIENRINNHIEDKIIGILGQAGKKSAQGSGKAYGLSGITKKLNRPYFDDNGDLQFDSTMPFEMPKVNLNCG